MSKFPDETTTLACLVAGSTHVSRLLTLIPLVLTHSSGIHFAPIFGTWEGEGGGGDDAADLSRGAEVEESPEATENELDDGTNEGAKEAMETQHHSV